MTITVFTPTYNRAYILTKLYASLLKQTCTDFEWLVVDDGSTDGTNVLFDDWTKNSQFPIRYFTIPNGGKHRAINYGSKLAHGELFYIVDSDDQLPCDAIDVIKAEYKKVKDNPKIGGVCGLKAYFTGEKVGGEQFFGSLVCNALDFRYKYKIKGDMAEAFKTAAIREYPFPEITGENFCPEAVVWQRFSAKYDFYYFYKKTYLCGYLPDGLTAQITRIRMQCPVASTICYAELAASKIPMLQKIRASINYWRFWFCQSPNKKACISPKWIFTMPIGWLIHLHDKRHN